MFNCTSRRHFREAEIVRKRVAEDDRVQRWSNVQGYYKSCDLSSSRQAHWEVSGSAAKTKTPEMLVIEERKSNLDVRRQQLKNLLNGETEELLKENGRSSKEVWKNSPMLENSTRSINNCRNFVTLIGEEPVQDSCDQEMVSEDDCSKLEFLMGNIRLDDEQLCKLEVEVADKLKKLLNVNKIFQSLSTINYKFKSDATRFEQWKQMCVAVQNFLKISISFIQEMRCSAGDFQMSVRFLDRLMEHEKLLQDSLKVESSEDRFVRLLEQTRREPNKKWFQEEMAKWERERKLRVKRNEDIYREFQSFVKDWAEKNPDKISALFENED